MMSQRSEAILACEKTVQLCGALLAKGVHVNQVIHEHKLPLPPLDLHAVHATLQSAESMLANLEIKAPRLVAA